MCRYGELEGPFGLLEVNLGRGFLDVVTEVFTQFGGRERRLDAIRMDRLVADFGEVGNFQLSGGG